MSDRKQQHKQKEQDIFSSIPSSESPDLFSGLDLNGMCVSPQETSDPEDISSDPMFDLNSLQDVNIQDITIGHGKSSQENILATLHSKNSRNHSPMDKQKKNKQSGPVHPLVKKASQYAELTRIRETIISNLTEQDGQTLLLSSANDGTGQSLIAAAIGYNIAQTTDKSTLLLDCNMRLPSLHSFFGMQQRNGLTKIFKENLPWHRMLKATELDNLHVLTAGTIHFDFSSYLQSHHLPNLLKTLSNSFDLIIIDSSPILTQNRNNIDTVLLTAISDYSLLIVNNGLTNKEELKEVKALIQTGNGKIDGIIYNHHQQDSMYSSFFNKLQRRKKGI